MTHESHKFLFSFLFFTPINCSLRITHESHTQDATEEIEERKDYKIQQTFNFHLVENYELRDIELRS